MSQQSRPPRFGWQALLILLPVAVLAVIGFVSLRHDRALVEAEANERAQALATELSQKAWEAITAPPAPGAIQYRVLVDLRTGELLAPKAYPPTPTPAPLDTAKLNDAQRQLWLAANSAQIPPAQLSHAITNLTQFLELAPPAEFAAVGRFALARWLAQSGQTMLAASNFAAVAGSYSNAVGESGLPLRPLALLHQLILASNASPSAAERTSALETLCREAVSSPTILTAHLLGRAAELEQSWGDTSITSRWRHQWEADEVSRALYAATRPHFPALSANTNLVGMAYGLPISRLLRLSAARELPGGAPDTEWFAQTDGGAKQGLWIRYRAAAELVEVLNRVHSTAPIPDYFGVSVEVGGSLLTQLVDVRAVEWVNYMSRSGGGQRRVPRLEFPWLTNSLTGNVLATSPVVGTTMIWPVGHVAPTDVLLQVRVHLTDSLALFARQQARTFWFGALIAVSALAALVGLATARLAFLQQLRLNELKSNFVSSVSHELRAPVASVRLMAESLERGRIPDPARQHEYFRLIGQETRRLTALIENVLDFSRIEQGRKQYEFEPTDLAALIHETVRLLRPYADAKGVTLVTSDLGLRTSDFVLDGRAIQQALVNLIDNAIKHSPAGETVTVGLEAPSAADQVAGGKATAGVNLPPRTPHSALRISVTDHGSGIPAAEHAKIFERFYRLGSELRRETQGVGIGLSIVKHIAEAHRGRVCVESEVGQGSRFVIELPVEAVAEARSETPNPKSE